MTRRDPSLDIELEKSLQTGSLNLSGLELTSLPDSLFRLTHITKLDISNNRLSELDKRIGTLRRLTHLVAHSNRISEWPDELNELASLEFLDIALNKFASCAIDIQKLRKLNYLRIGSNPLNGKLEFLSNAPHLQILIADRIGANELPAPITTIKQLRQLNVAGNPIRSIPKSFVDLINLGTIVIDTEALDAPPPEIVQRGPGSIINYLHSFQDQGPTITIREAKLLVVGEGAVGKTSLVQRIIFDKFDSESQTTEGIDIKSWRFTASNKTLFTANIWDFGGQEIYHSTHQFFLTKRSLYMFIWDARKEENIHTFDYWLSVVTLLGKGAPILFVMNKSDERLKPIDEQAFQKKFPNICGFFRVSAKLGSRIEELREEIRTQISSLPHVGDVLPMTWVNIRRELEGLKRNYIRHDEYLRICARYGMPTQQAEYVSQYFHDLGVFLHFQENEILKQTIFLSPEWATGAVYKLIDTKSVQLRLGRFMRSELTEIWSEYPRNRHADLLELMKRFELCFEIGESQEFIVPELLDPNPAQIEWDEKENLHFQFLYDFMPAGILTRFIVRTHDLIRADQFWKYGVVLQRELSDALVLAEPLFRRIVVKVRGPDRAALLTIIRRELEVIHQTLNLPNVQAAIPCPCNVCAASTTPYMHPYESLRRARARRKFTVECKESFEDVRVDEIWNILRSPGRQTVSPEIGTTVSVGKLEIEKLFDEELDDLGLASNLEYNGVVTGLSSLKSDVKAISELETILNLLRTKDTQEKFNKEIEHFCRKHGIALPRKIEISGLSRLFRSIFRIN